MKEDKILKLVKEKPLSAVELQTQLQLSDRSMDTIIQFLIKHDFINKEDGMVSITEPGVKLLSLPDLLEDELPKDQMEILEQFWVDKIDKELEVKK